MPNTTDVGRVYFHTMKYPETNGVPPRIDIANTQEIEEPFRVGRGLIVRYRGLKGFVVGWWRKPAPLHEWREDEALIRALEGAVLDVDPEVLRAW